MEVETHMSVSLFAIYVKVQLLAYFFGRSLPAIPLRGIDLQPPMVDHFAGRDFDASLKPATRTQCR